MDAVGGVGEGVDEGLSEKRTTFFFQAVAFQLRARMVLERRYEQRSVRSEDTLPNADTLSIGNSVK